MKAPSIRRKVTVSYASNVLLSIADTTENFTRDYSMIHNHIYLSCVNHTGNQCVTIFSVKWKLSHLNREERNQVDRHTFR